MGIWPDKTARVSESVRLEAKQIDQGAIFATEDAIDTSRHQPALLMDFVLRAIHGIPNKRYTSSDHIRCRIRYDPSPLLDKSTTSQETSSTGDTLCGGFRLGCFGMHENLNKIISPKLHCCFSTDSAPNFSVEPEWYGETLRQVRRNGDDNICCSPINPDLWRRFVDFTQAVPEQIAFTDTMTLVESERPIRRTADDRLQ